MSTDDNKPAELLQQLLLDLLKAGTVVNWPGADGITVDDVVNCYPQAIADGEVPGWHELQGRFPELADALQTLRSARGWLASRPCCRSKQNRSPRRDELSQTDSRGTLSMPSDVNQPQPATAEDENCRLHRWLVSFASESGWYPVGEYIALDAAAAIERAVEVFGPGAACQAEEIPWDAAPLSRANLSPVQK